MLDEETENSCKGTVDAPKKGFVAFSDCTYSPPPIENCPEEVVVTEEDIKSKGTIIDETADPYEYAPLFKSIVVPEAGVCMTKISAAAGLDKNVGFGATEWQDEIFVSLTKLEEGETFD